MRQLLDGLERAGQRSTGPSRVELASAMREAQQAFLRIALGGEGELRGEPLRELRDHANYLELLAEEVGQDQALDASYVCGTILEWLARLEPDPEGEAYPRDLNSGPVGDLVRASLAYSAGLHEASSALAARRALTVFDGLPPRNPVFDSAARLILAFLARRFGDSIDAYVTYANAVRAYLPNPAGPIGDWYQTGLLSRAAEAAASMSAGMLAANEELVSASMERMRTAVGSALRAGDQQLASLLERLGGSMEGMATRSAHRVLNESGLDAGVIRRYAAWAPELWSSQVEAIGRGLLNPDSSFVLSLPTGSGKTFLAQLRILSAFAAYPEKWVAYIAPTRALVREVHRELSAGLRPFGVQVRKIVASAEAAALADEDELSTIARPRTCVVLTPERLDVYLRAQPEMASSCGLVIVDEAHQLSDGERGSRLEALLTLILVKWTEIRIVLLSAFLPNASELAQWLGNPDAYYQTTLRPTRQLRGVCVRYGQERLNDQYVYRGRSNVVLDQPRPEPPDRMYRERRSYRVGAVLASSPADLQAAAVAIPNLAYGENWIDQPAVGRRKEGLTGITEIASRVATSLAAHPGLVLVFLTHTEWAQSCATRVARSLPEKPAAWVFRDAAASFLGREHPLAESLAHGVGYHTARLPEEALRIVEAAARAGVLEVLCATPTVHAGVNLPASIVVVVGDPKPSDTPRPSFRDFANMAGRAGRPRFDSEGIALYLPPAVTRRSDIGQWARRYVLPGDGDFAVHSALADELEALIRDPVVRPLEDLSPTLQQILLALWAADLRTDRQLGEYLERTLASRHLAGPLPELLATTLSNAADMDADAFAAYSKTALPYATCCDLKAAVPRLRQSANADGWSESASAQAYAVAFLVAEIPYFATKVHSLLDPDADAELVATLMGLWVSGADYSQLADRIAVHLDTTSDVPKAINAVHGIASYIAWGAGSLISIANAQEELTTAHLLPYFIRFGVNSAAAAYLRLIGVSDRVGSIRLGEQFPEGLDVTLSTVETWSRSPEVHEALRGYYGENGVSREATEMDLGLTEDADAFVPLFVRLSGAPPEWIRVGRLVVVGRELTGWSARDVVGEREWAIPAVAASGIAAITAVAPDHAVACIVRPNAGTAQTG
jgi:hypothetical protein